MGNPEHLADRPITAAVAAVLAARRREYETRGPICPRCGDDRVWVHGKSPRGFRRYRCRRCRRTFSETTGTVLANVRGRRSWQDHAGCMDDGLTLRETAARLGIAVATAFRWRHALLQSLLSADRSVLHGAVGFDNLWLPLNEKGRRDLDRPARTRGVANRFTYTGPSVRALLARDVDGTVCSHVAWIGRSLPMARDLIEAFGARVLPGTSVHSFLGPISQPARFARHVGGAFRMPDPPVQQPWARRRPPTARRSAVTGPWPGRVECVSVDCRRDRSPTFTVRLYAQLLRRWLMRFRGVATRYLLRYLVWHPIVDGDGGGGGGDASGANGGPPAGGEATQAAK